MEISAARERLPEFEKPPVLETVLSVQFEPIPGLTAAHFGLFWSRVRADFPQTDTKPPLEPQIEQLELAQPDAIEFRVAPRAGLAPLRVWFVNAGGTELIQLQADRFIKNWRKSGDADVYPRYEKAVRPGFARDYARFSEWLEEESLPAPRISQCEVSYINHIVAGPGWSHWSQAEFVFPFLRSLPASFEDGVFLLRFPILQEGRPVGRLTVEIQPALRASDRRPLWVMSLTARGNLPDPMEFFDLGRQTLVSKFAELTSGRMHEIWERSH